MLFLNLLCSLQAHLLQKMTSCNTLLSQVSFLSKEHWVGKGCGARRLVTQEANEGKEALGHTGQFTHTPPDINATDLKSLIIKLL